MKHRVKIAGRAADDLEHLRRGRLLLQQFGEIVGALAQFGQQPRVLDGDDGLSREVRHQPYLFVSKGLDLMAGEDERSDNFVVLEHRHHKGRPYAAKFDAHNGAG